EQDWQFSQGARVRIGAAAGVTVLHLSRGEDRTRSRQSRDAASRRVFARDAYQLSALERPAGCGDAGRRRKRRTATERRARAAGLDAWVPYTFSPEDNRAGLLTLAGFLMLDPTHEGRTSPTIRGKSVRELLLCQKIPPPPANVDFKLVQDTKNPQFKTARDRL